MNARAKAAAGEAPAVEPVERFRLGLDELRFVAVWLRLENTVYVDLPAEVADLMRPRRAEWSSC